MAGFESGGAPEHRDHQAAEACTKSPESPPRVSPGTFVGKVEAPGGGFQQQPQGGMAGSGFGGGAGGFMGGAIGGIWASVGQRPAATLPPSSAPAAPIPQAPSNNNMVGAEFYQNAVLNAGIPVVALDTAGCIISWNAAATRLFGRGEAEVMGRSIEMLIPGEYRSIAAKAFQRSIQQRSVNTYEMSLVPQGGKNPTHVGVTLSCVIDSAGALRGVMAWMRDISSRKELEAHLMRTRHMASVGTLAAGVAHHFNNIACGMGAMVEFALATEDSAAMLKALRMSAEACSRISYITQSMLACSGDASAECGEQDLSDLTEETLRFADAVEPTLNHKGIHLQLDLQASRIAAVPRVRFGQALHHLLRNAEDAIDQRSQKAAATGEVFEKRITIRTQSQGDQIMMQVADTGIGIEPDDMPQIFDPFFTKKGVQGGGNRNNPGLGLTLVHSVVMDMGGHIWADSTLGQGTTVFMLIPVVA